MKKLIIILIGLASFNIAYSQNKFGNLSWGGSIGYSNYDRINAECYVQIHTQVFGREFETKGGFNYSPFTTSYRTLNDLDVGSVGFFAEGSIYPFQKYLFTGIRWELLDVNWFTPKTVDRLDNALVSPSIMFTGTRLYGVVGVDIPIRKALKFRIYGMPGIHNYRIPDASYTRSYPDKSYLEFSYQINAGLVLQMSH